MEQHRRELEIWMVFAVYEWKVYILCVSLRRMSGIDAYEKERLNNLVGLSINKLVGMHLF